MSQAKRTNPNKNAQSTSSKKPPARAGVNKQALIIGAVVVVAIAGAIAFANNGSKSPSLTSISPEEQKYTGRYLPAGYVEPAIADAITYTSAVTMVPVVAAESASGLAIPVSDVVSKKIVTFDAQKAGAPVTMIAFVKPSGKAFVGVSFCPPCKGKGQRIEPDGTLTCESCGTKRDLETGAGVSGPCKLYPLDELPVTVDGDKIVVAQADIDAWSEQPLDRKVGQ